jgi:anti-sigma B factor antagonist
MLSSQLSDATHPPDPHPGFSCAVHSQGPGVTRVALSGELDMLSAPDLDDTLADASRGAVAVIVDLSQLTFMDSSGLHALLTARARLAESDCRLVLLRGGDQVQRLFELTGLDGVLEFVSVRDAGGLAAIPST